MVEVETESMNGLVENLRLHLKIIDACQNPEYLNMFIHAVIRGDTDHSSVQEIHELCERDLKMLEESRHMDILFPPPTPPPPRSPQPNE
jgi:hypothetical protein